MVIEYGLLILVVAAVLIAYFLLKTAKHLIVNAVLGLIALVAVNIIFGLLHMRDITYTWLVILICAIGGIFGAALVILFHLLGIAF